MLEKALASEGTWLEPNRWQGLNMLGLHYYYVFDGKLPRPDNPIWLYCGELYDGVTPDIAAALRITPERVWKETVSALEPTSGTARDSHSFLAYAY